MDNEFARERDLLDAALGACRRSYSPYSEFPVGASVLAGNGKIYTGVNIENASYGLTICAERVAIFKAIEDEGGPIEWMAICTPTRTPTAPCGACRQVLREFAASNCRVLAVCDSDQRLEVDLDQLLPVSFGPEHVFQDRTPKGRVRICVDLDNVVTQTDKVIRCLIERHTNGRVKFDYEDIRSFNYWECQGIGSTELDRSEWENVHREFSTSNVIRQLEPMKDAIVALHHLATLGDLHFVTSRLPSARAATATWLESVDLVNHDLHFVKHGEKHAALGRFDIAIEDDPLQAVAFADAGYSWSLLFDHPWNRDIKSSEKLHRVHSWKEITEVVEQIVAQRSMRPQN